MKTENGNMNLPIAAIGALELGQKPEAVRIVRQELNVKPEQASAMVEHYLNAHPVSRIPGYAASNHDPLFWIIIGLLALAVGLVIFWGYV